MKLAMPVKTATLDFTDEGYPGFECETWVNPPMREAQRYYALADVDQDEARRILLQFFPSWNFVDADGESIPHNADGFDAMPQELLVAMGRLRNDAIRERAMSAPLERSSSPTSKNGSTASPTQMIPDPTMESGR